MNFNPCSVKYLHELLQETKSRLVFSFMVSFPNANFIIGSYMRTVQGRQQFNEQNKEETNESLQGLLLYAREKNIKKHVKIMLFLPGSFCNIMQIYL